MEREKEGWKGTKIRWVEYKDEKTRNNRTE